MDVETFLQTKNINVSEADGQFQVYIERLCYSFEQSLERLNQEEQKYLSEAEELLWRHRQNRDVSTAEATVRISAIQQRFENGRKKLQEGLCEAIRQLQAKYEAQRTKAKANAYDNKVTSILNAWFAEHIDNP